MAPTAATEAESINAQKAAQQGEKRQFEWDNDVDWDEDERAAQRRLQAFARAAVTVVPWKGWDSKRHEGEQKETLGLSNTPFEGVMGEEQMEHGQQGENVEEVTGVVGQT